MKKEKTQNDEGKVVAWKCSVCGYIETAYPDGLPDDYTCPVCGAKAKKFKKVMISPTR